MSAARIAIDQPTRRLDTWVRPPGELLDDVPDVADRRIRYHPPIFHRIIIPRRASSAHHPMLDWPRGTTRNAARSGPNDDPTFPPTWKSDCARPCRPPEAILATRDDSGCNTDDPIPTRAA